MRALVVDDEEPARRRLTRLLGELEGVSVVAEAVDGEDALAQIARLAPEVVLLDISMPRLDGLSLAARFTELPPIIFVTAYDEHAVRAFEVNAVDYLLKPVTRARLAQAIARLRERRPVAAARPVLDELAPVGPARVVATERGVIRLFEAQAITRFWSADKYTLFRADGAEHMTEEPLAALADRLAPLGFLRVHRAELVRLDAVRALAAGDGMFELTLSDGQTARVSRRSLGDVKRALGLK